jgi:glycosyltransferase involved in cell wall biosynthesis
LTQSFTREPVSVCMATYNGEKFLKAQIESILVQFECKDELVIVDDSSTDATQEIILSFQDSRIILHVNIENIGPIGTFERCLNRSKYDVIFFADQDDIWENHRLNLLRDELLGADVDLVCSNMTLIDETSAKLNYLRLPPLVPKGSKQPIKNLIKVFRGRMGYFGCTMVFRRDFLKVVLPLPRHIESHDLWFAVCANILMSIRHLEAITLKHRIHGNNASIIRRSIFKKIFARVLLLQQVIIAVMRINGSSR